MKTLFFKLAMAILGVMLMSSVLDQSLSAQTIISFDSTPENTMVFKIRNHDLVRKPHRYVFIFDSARVTYEYNELGEIALYTVDLSSGESSFEKKQTNVHPAEAEFKFDPDVLEEAVEEEPLEVEAWMLNPTKWGN
ncbi:MAG: hypothetical protein JW801_03165 [Bacteroidales bacterium]|nr:hypothetical protein [Bacteroidales bacterium]